MQSSTRRQLEIKQPFRPRPVSFLELWEHGAWRLKVYGLSTVHQQPPPELVRAAKDAAASLLPAKSEASDTYGVGFIVVHEGRNTNHVSIDWWVQENELEHHVYRSSIAEPAALQPEDSSVAGCVWDLQVIWFERNAWVEKVLGNALGADLDAYLRRHLSDQA